MRILRKMQASDPSANLRVKVPELFVSQVSKIARPGHPARGQSRFLTAKAVRNDKRERVQRHPRSEMFYGASEGRMLTRILRKMQASDPSANLPATGP